MIVSDSFPLIYLANLNHLKLLRELFNDVSVPEEVMSEIARGKELGFEDAEVIEKAKKDGWIKTISLEDKQRKDVSELLQTFDGISRADASAIVLAESSDSVLCTDDGRAVTVAEVLDVKCIGTLGILLLAVKRDLMSKKQVRELALSLPKRGFYLTHSLLAEFLKKLDHLH